MYMLELDDVIHYEPLQNNENHVYVEKPIQISERRENKLRKKTIPYVKVLWKHHKAAEAAWEPEQEYGRST